MNARSRIFVALDGPLTNQDMVRVVDATSEVVAGYKIGLRLIYAMGPQRAVRFLRDLGVFEIFLDAKLKDIPNTVYEAATEIAMLGVDWLNLHCLGGTEMMKAAMRAVREVAKKTSRPRTKVLGVTVLTSLDYEALVQLGIVNNYDVAVEHPDSGAFKQREVQDLVVHLAKLAQRCGLDGVIASLQEAAVIRKVCGPNFEIVTPGIRSSQDPADDQKRTATAAEAIRAGATRLVIGRPIVKAQDSGAAAQQFAQEIEEVLAIKTQV